MSATPISHPELFIVVMVEEQRQTLMNTLACHKMTRFLVKMVRKKSTNNTGRQMITEQVLPDVQRLLGRTLVLCAPGLILFTQLNIIKTFLYAHPMRGRAVGL